MKNNTKLIITINDLTDLEFEQLADKCFDDPVLLEDFIAENYEDFENAMYERGIDTDYYCDYEFQYCESRDEDFVNFGFKKYYGGRK